jgi:organic hydroperoxide reductase OsmC/OhrA
MHPYPHRYRVQAQGKRIGTVRVTAQALPVLETHAPEEFDGPGGYWSPESLLMASIADCFILSFRAVANASKLEWEELSVGVEGVLDRVDGVTRFVSYAVSPRLSISSVDSEQLAGTVLAKAKRACLVSNSLIAQGNLLPRIEVSSGAAEKTPSLQPGPA